MKRSTLLFSLLFLFNCIAIARDHNKKNIGNPVLVFINNDTVYDFGSIPQGEFVENQFEIKNIGSAPLVITAVKCDSGKITCKSNRKSIKPGKTAAITITYRAGGDAGSFLDNVVITSNATKAPYPFLHIKGAVVPGRDHYTLSPKYNPKHNHREACAGCYIWPPVSH